MQQVSQEFTEQLQSGKTVAKLILYKPDEAGQDKKEAEPEGNKCTGEDMVTILTAQTDAMFAAAKVIYGCCPTEGDVYPLSIEADR
jgi:hypothetical protein